MNMDNQKPELNTNVSRIEGTITPQFNPNPELDPNVSRIESAPQFKK